eukprot:5158345-Amphidinium_carterae.1
MNGDVPQASPQRIVEWFADYAELKVLRWKITSRCVVEEQQMEPHSDFSLLTRLGVAVYSSLCFEDEPCVVNGGQSGRVSAVRRCPIPCCNGRQYHILADIRALGRWDVPRWRDTLVMLPYSVVQVDALEVSVDKLRREFEEHSLSDARVTQLRLSRQALPKGKFAPQLFPCGALSVQHGQKTSPWRGGWSDMPHTRPMLPHFGWRVEEKLDGAWIYLQSLRVRQTVTNVRIVKTCSHPALEQDVHAHLERSLNELQRHLEHAAVIASKAVQASGSQSLNARSNVTAISNCLAGANSQSIKLRQSSNEGDKNSQKLDSCGI